MSTIDNSELYARLGLTANTTETKDSGQLGLEQFLELMTTQLTNQNPLEPTENGDFLGQIAQFGTVSGIEQLNTSFGDFTASMASGQALQASELVGREVLAPVSVGLLEAGGAIRGRIGLDTSANQIRVEITNENGELVRSMELGAHKAGPVDFTWDGLNENDEYAEPGTYNIKIEALQGGEYQAQQPYIFNKVDSVTLAYGSEGLSVNLAGLGSMPYSEIVSIH
ncbi:MAG: flagellar hook assembly protein FlgD [Chromatiales bacterium]|jgi:flagellar basal-body rod modification protein FlgD